MLALLRNVVVVVALILGAAFCYFNLQVVTIDLLWLTTEAPLVVLLVLAFALGFVVALLVGVYKITHLRARLSRSRRQLRDAQAEIRNLRSMPIHDA